MTTSFLSHSTPNPPASSDGSTCETDQKMTIPHHARFPVMVKAIIIAHQQHGNSLSTALLISTGPLHLFSSCSQSYSLKMNSYYSLKIKVKTSQSLVQCSLVTSLHMKSKSQRLLMVYRPLPNCIRLSY